MFSLSLHQCKLLRFSRYVVGRVFVFSLKPTQQPKEDALQGQTQSLAGARSIVDEIDGSPNHTPKGS